MAATAALSASTDAQQDIAATVEAIRRAAIKIEDVRRQPHPLPLAASWSAGPYSNGFGPNFQMQRIRAGDYLLPWFPLTRPDDPFVAYPFEAAFRRAADLGLPISFLSTQWDVLVAEELRYRETNATNERRRVRIPREELRPLSPFSPLDAWYEVGRRWGGHPALRRLQTLYPAPPLVLFVSNNEQRRLSWRELLDSPEVHQFLGSNPSEESVRRAAGDGWIERYRALQSGFRDALTAPGWKQSSIFVGFNALGAASTGRWSRWIDYSLIVQERLEPWPQAWEGVSPPYYVSDWNPITDFQVRSPQVESMNWLPVLEEAYQRNPGLWFELSMWDGQQPTSPTDKASYYRKLGQTFDPQRYEGYLQFGIWLLRPRVVREFRDPLATRAQFEGYFDSVTTAVRRVHEIPELRQFWRSGRLVANTLAEHPYTVALPERLAGAQRWYLLDSDLNAKRPWALDTPLRVYALALEMGTAPQRSWLTYVFTPLDSTVATKLKIPDGPTIEVQGSRAGCFSLLHEGDATPRVLASDDTSAIRLRLTAITATRSRTESSGAGTR